MRFSEIETRIDEVTRPDSIYDASQKLMAAGYDVLGSGAFGRVFQKPGQPFVLKLFSSLDTSYLAFIKLAQTHPSPHFPKFIGKVVRVTGDYFAVRTEPLRKYRGNSLLIQRYFLYRDTEFPDPNSHMAMQALDALEFMESEPGFQKACDLVIDKLIIPHPEFRMDVTDNNILMRGDTMVLSDPVALTSGFASTPVGKHVPTTDRSRPPKSRPISPEMQAEIDELLAELQ